MTGELEVVFIEKPEESAWGIIGGGLHQFNLQNAGDENFQRLCFGVFDAEQTLIAGILGELFWGWLNLDLLWVKEEYRGQGYGQRLVKTLEVEAQKRGAKHVFLDTFSFQAPDFYKKYGYEVYGKLQDFPPGHQRYYLVKHL